MKPWLLLIAILTLTAGAYGGLINAGHAWDDYSLVRDNAYTGSWSNLGAFFSLDLWETTRLAPHGSGFYRPLFLTSLAVDYSLFGTSPGGAHLHSVVWHLLAVVLLFQLGRKLAGAWTGLVAAALFALHPVQHEAVALIAARNDSMATVFVLATLLLLFDTPVTKKRLVAGGFTLLLALLSKESAVLTLGVLWGLDRARGQKEGRRSRYIVLLLATGAYLLLRLSSSVGDSSWPTREQWDQALTNGPQILGTYSELLLWPSTLTPARSINFLDDASRLVPYLLVASIGLLVLLRASRQKPAIGACLFWAALCLAPTVLVTVGKGNLGERYLYMPMAGLSLAVAMALPRARGTSLAVAGFVVLALTQILPRNSAWTNYATLWGAAYQDRPSTFTAGGYAWAKENIEKDPLGARELYMEALRGEPVYHTACEAAVLVNVRLKRFESAIAVADWAQKERQCPTTPMLTDAILYSLGGSGQHQRIREIFGGAPTGPKPSPGATLAYAAQKRDREGVAGILGGSSAPKRQLADAFFFLEEVVRDEETRTWLRAQTTPASAGAGPGRSP